MPREQDGEAIERESAGGVSPCAGGGGGGGLPQGMFNPVYLGDIL